MVLIVEDKLRFPLLLQYLTKVCLLYYIIHAQLISFSSLKITWLFILYVIFLQHILTGTPPSAAEDIEIVNGTVDFVTTSLLLNITWKPPFPYGKLFAYNLVLTAEFSNENETFNQTLTSRFFPVSLFAHN